MRRKFYMGLVLGLTTGVPLARAYDALYAFGDSLTDTGREPAEPYFHYHGRWSNGPLWVEYLSDRLGFPYNPDNNLAHSGAQTDDTLGQVREFVPTTDVGRSLFVVWAGGNDFLQEYTKNWFSNSSWDRQIAYSVGNLSNAVVALYSKGARFILVPNTVDVTDIPALNSLPGFIRDYLRGKVEQFNRELAEALARIQWAYGTLTLFQFDFYGEVKSFLANASAYGFTETHIDALGDVTLLDKSFDGPGADYVFWDPIHPTTKSHRVIADWFLSFVAPLSPQISVAASGTAVELRLERLDPGTTYVLQSSDDLSVWSDMKWFSTASSRYFTTIKPNALPQTFFRVKWLPPDRVEGRPLANGMLARIHRQFGE